MTTLEVQGSRRRGAEGAYQFITSTKAGWSDSIPIHDPWWILGWFGIGAMLYLRGRSPTALILAWPAIAYASSMAILAAPQLIDRYGWYRLAVYPLVYLSAGYLVWRSMRRPTIAPLALILGVAGGLAFNAFGTGSLPTDLATELGGKGPTSPSTQLLVILGGAILLPTVIAAWQPQRLWILTARMTTGLGLAAIFIVATLSSWHSADVYTHI